MQISARVDVVRNAGGDDSKDCGGALAAPVEPGKEPVLSAQDEASQLALAAVVGRLDIAVIEEQLEPFPLASALRTYIEQMTDRVLAAVIHDDTSDANEKAEPPLLAAGPVAEVKE